jgi:hypothetical protein
MWLEDAKLLSAEFIPGTGIRQGRENRSAVS